jgi:hypothetical protein
MSSSVRRSGATSHLYQSEWWMRLASFKEYNEALQGGRRRRRGFRFNLRWPLVLMKALSGEPGRK